MEKKTTLIIGASANPSRYSYLAADRLLSYNHRVELLGLRADTIFGQTIDTEKKAYDNIDTVTLYIGPARQPEFYEYVISLKPRRVVFNPGTENFEFMELLREHGILVDVSCMLVMLSTGQY